MSRTKSEPPLRGAPLEEPKHITSVSQSTLCLTRNAVSPGSQSQTPRQRGALDVLPCSFSLPVSRFLLAYKNIFLPPILQFSGIENETACFMQCLCCLTCILFLFNTGLKRVPLLLLHLHLFSLCFTLAKHPAPTKEHTVFSSVGVSAVPGIMAAGLRSEAAPSLQSALNKWLWN